MQNKLRQACLKMWEEGKKSSQARKKLKEASLQHLWSPRDNKGQVDEAQTTSTYEHFEETKMLEVQPLFFINQVLQVCAISLHKNWTKIYFSNILTEMSQIRIGKIAISTCSVQFFLQGACTFPQAWPDDFHVHLPPLPCLVCHCLELGKPQAEPPESQFVDIWMEGPQ